MRIGISSLDTDDKIMAAVAQRIGRHEFICNGFIQKMSLNCHLNVTGSPQVSVNDDWLVQHQDTDNVDAGGPLAQVLDTYMTLFVQNHFEQSDGVGFLPKQFCGSHDDFGTFHKVLVKAMMTSIPLPGSISLAFWAAFLEGDDLKLSYLKEYSPIIYKNLTKKFHMDGHNDMHLVLEELEENLVLTRPGMVATKSASQASPFLAKIRIGATLTEFLDLYAGTVKMTPEQVCDCVNFNFDSSYASLMKEWILSLNDTDLHLFWSSVSGVRSWSKHKTINVVIDESRDIGGPPFVQVCGNQLRIPPYPDKSFFVVGMGQLITQIALLGPEFDSV